MKTVNKIICIVIIAVIVLLIVCSQKCTAKYTLYDFEYLKKLVIEKDYTTQDLKKYDFNNDGILSGVDLIRLRNIMNNE